MATLTRTLGPFVMAGLVLLLIVWSAQSQELPGSTLPKMTLQTQSSAGNASTREPSKFVYTEERLDRAARTAPHGTRPAKEEPVRANSGAAKPMFFGKPGLPSTIAHQHGGSLQTGMGRVRSDDSWTMSEDIRPGQAARLTLPPVSAPTLFTGDYAYRITVPAGATRMQVRLETQTPGADLDLFVRYAEEPAVSDGQVVADYASLGMTGNEQVTVTSASSPPLRSGVYYAAVAVFTPNLDIQATLTVVFDSSGGSDTPSLQRYSVVLPAVDGPTLFTGDFGVRIPVPGGARRMEVRLVTSTPGVDVDLFLRYGADPTVTNGGIVADYASTGEGGGESIAVTTSSEPALREGTYFAAFVVWTPGVDVSATLEVTVDGGPGTVTDGGSNTLQPGSPATFQLPAVSDPTLFVGNQGYRVVVPQGANRLRIQLRTATRDVDVDLLVRYGADVEISDDRILADYASVGFTGDEAIEVNGSSTPPLRPGVYFIALAVYGTGIPVSGTISAFIDSDPSPEPPSNVLQSGVPASFDLPAVTNPTLFHGDYSYRIKVPAGSSRLEVSLSTATDGADVDLFVRHGADTELSNGRLVTDYVSVGLTGEERIVITPSSQPALQAGDYYISFGLFTLDRPVRASVTATISGAGSTRDDNIRSNVLARQPLIK